MICAFPARLSEKTTRACGKCHPCRENLRRKWLLRLECEARMYESSLFVTLTYDEEHQPTCRDPETGEVIGTLDKTDLRAFLKLIRQSVSRTQSSTNSSSPQGRYYGCGEYGTKTERPHYHAILFGLDESWRETIERLWKGGFVSIRKADRTNMRYTLKYVLKNYSDPESPWLRGRQPTFALMSQRPAIGTSFLPLVAKMLKKAACDAQGNPMVEFPREMRIDGELMPMDRTMRNALKKCLGFSVEQEVHAFPRYVEKEVSDGKKTQAENRHRKAWRDRKTVKYSTV